MANQFNTEVMIAEKMLQFLSGSSTVLKYVNRKYEADFLAHKGRMGQTLQIEKPPRFATVDGPVLTGVQDVVIPLTNVTINKWKTVAVKLTGKERTFTANNFDLMAEKYVKPVADAIIKDVTNDIFGLASQVANFMGTPGTGFGTTAPAGMTNLLNGKAKLDYFNTPENDRVLFLDPMSAAKLGAQLSTNFNPTGDVSKTIKTGAIPPIGGFNIFQAPNVYSQTVGNYAGTPVINGANQQGNSIVTNGWTASKSLAAGDVIQFAGVYSVNPSTKSSTGLLQDFVVTAATTADGSGNMTIPVYPSIITSGAFQNVTASPANSASVSVKTGTANSSYHQNFGWWKDALGLVSVPVDNLTEFGLPGVTKNFDGLSVTVSKGGDFMQYEGYWRVDFVYGVCVHYNEQAIRFTD